MADFNAKFSLFRPKVLETTLIAIYSNSVYSEKNRKSYQKKIAMTSVTIEETRVETQKIVSAVFRSTQGMILLILSKSVSDAI